MNTIKSLHAQDDTINTRNDTVKIIICDALLFTEILYSCYCIMSLIQTVFPALAITKSHVDRLVALSGTGPDTPDTGGHWRRDTR